MWRLNAQLCMLLLREELLPEHRWLQLVVCRTDTAFRLQDYHMGWPGGITPQKTCIHPQHSGSQPAGPCCCCCCCCPCISHTPQVGILIVFSFCCQMACGAVFGIVPFVSKRSTGTVTGTVAAGGSLGSAVTQVRLPGLLRQC
jgi:hypothetical protein